MEFWGVEVKPGETIKCEPGEGRLLHLSQVALGVAKDKGAEKVPMFVKIDGQKLLLGTLSADNCAQISFDLVFEKDFELFHGSKKTSVCFTGYKSVLPDEEPSDDDMFSDSDSDAEDVNIQLKPNGNSKVKGKEGKSIAETGKDNAVAKQKAKPAEQIKNDKPKADDNADEDDSDDDDEDYSGDESGDDVDMADAMSDSDDDDNDSDEESDEEEETPPMKAASGKKRQAESASKTPEKKAKLVTPSGGKKTGGDEKKGGHVATPHPSKKGEKTPASSDKPKQQTPKSAAVKCGSCSKTFTSEAGLQAHTKAKHSATK